MGSLGSGVQMPESEQSGKQFIREQEIEPLQAVPFPPLPSITYGGEVDCELEVLFHLSQATADGKLFKAIQAAWAVISSLYTNHDKTLFDIAWPSNARIPEIGNGIHPPIHIETVCTELEPNRSFEDFLCDFYDGEENSTVVHDATSSQSPAQDGGQESTAILLFLPSAHEIDELGSYFNGPSADADRFSSSYPMLIQCRQITPYSIECRFEFDSEVLGENQVLRLARQVEHMVMRLCLPGSGEDCLSELRSAGPFDMHDIWQRNATGPAHIELCTHEAIAVTVMRKPDTYAIRAWDGKLTYRQLDDLSTRLAHQVRNMTSGHGQVVVPLCFSKSMWTPVAMLAVMKAGAASVMLDVTQPTERLLAIINQIQSPLIMASADCHALAQTLTSGAVLTVDDSLRSSQKYKQALPRVLPSSTAHVLFTSGSTGIPKGVRWRFDTITNIAKIWKTELGLDQEKRVFQFSSYAFTIGLSETLITLVNGGCLCIPTEADRLSRVNEAVAKFDANFVVMTPSAVAALEPERVLCLQTIVLVGEPVQRGDVERWIGKAAIYNAYGATEYPFIACCRVDTRDWHKGWIGPPRGCVGWVVDPHDIRRPLPVGAVGMLALEGPLLGDYLGEKQGAEGMVTDIPPWLSTGLREHGRHASRIFVTGDLVKYREDGSLDLIARNNTLAKIRGQRVDLREVEHAILECSKSSTSLSVAAEVFVPSGTQSAQLVAFVSVALKDCSKQDRENAIHESLQGVGDRLRAGLPRYMVPSAYLPIEAIPKLASGKIDRKRLRDIGSGMSVEQLHNIRLSKRPRPVRVTTVEYKLIRSVAEVLQHKEDVIEPEHNFLEIGGDSIGAMRLVKSARERDLQISVTDVLEHPQLRDLAQHAHAVRTKTSAPAVPQPFALLPRSISASHARSEAAAQCQLLDEQIEDVYPCTPLQEGLLSMSIKQPGSYEALQVFNLQPEVDLERLESSLHILSRQFPILRTRIIELGDEGLAQCVVDVNIQPVDEAFCRAALRTRGKSTSGLGQALSWYSILHDVANGKWILVWSMHHAIADGWSISILIDALANTYEGVGVKPREDFRLFISHIKGINLTKASDYWKSQLQTAECSPYPSRPSTSYQPLADTIVCRDIDNVRWPLGHTPSNTIRTAVALLLAKYTGSNDAIFGVTVNGRQLPLHEIDKIAAPTIATVPLRVPIDWTMSLNQLMDQVQSQAARMIEFEQVGLQCIQRLSEDAKHACAFQTLLVVQPEGQGEPMDTENAIFQKKQHESEDAEYVTARVLNFGTYGLTLECFVNQSGMQIRMSSDSNLLPKAQATRLAQQLDHVLRQVSSSQTSRIADIEMTSEEDRKDLWHWNMAPPTPTKRCVHDIFQTTARNWPGNLAIDAWDGKFTYSELDTFSTQLACHLAELGVKPGVIVPLFFEKTRWTSAAMLAVSKAGGASVAMDMSLPQVRMQTILDQIQSHVVLASTTHENLAIQLARRESTVVVPEKMDVSSDVNTQQLLPSVVPSDVVYVVFTSGSTGTPKGVIITHSNLSTAFELQHEALGITQSSRVYDLSSYAFDVAWCNAIHALCAGGCLCVPHDDDRRDNIAGSIRGFRASYVFLTPTTLRTLGTSLDSCGLRDMAVSGEPVRDDDITSLRPNYNVNITYGPTECTTLGTLRRMDPAHPDGANIGNGLGLLPWVVDPITESDVVPIGAVGELWLEGPLVGKGYLNDDEKTAGVFVDDPSWLARGHSSRPGRKGRLYKTGDLVRFRYDGSLEFLRRKDDQVKIRGQRVELGEVEHHVRKSLAGHFRGQVVAEVILLQSGHPSLAVFFELGENDLASEEKHAFVSQVTDQLEEQLAMQLPTYMIPSLYYPIDRIPLTTTGKTDRRRLRALAKEGTIEQLAALRPSRTERRLPSTSNEQWLQTTWASLFGIPSSEIGAGDSFLRLGGDSIGAVRLVAEARKAGLLLKVSDVFAHPRLHDLAAVLSHAESSNALAQTIKPFTLLNDPVDEKTLKTIAADLTGAQPGEIEDVFPCTPLQEGLLALTSRRFEAYVGRIVLSLRAGVDTVRFQQAWNKVISSTGILRTRIVDIPGHGLVQVILKKAVEWCHSTTGVASLMDLEKQEPMGLGTPLVRFGLTDGDAAEPRCFLVTIHHSLYDGWTVPLLLRAAESAYRNEAWQSFSPFQGFAQYIKALDSDRIAQYWRAQFVDCRAVPFPPLSDPTYQPLADQAVMQNITGIQWPESDATPATMIRAAWTISSAYYTDTNDVMFGATVIGRQAPVAGIERMAGPTIATVPIRISFEWQQTVNSLLQQIQDQSTEMTHYEQIGLQQIRQVSKEAQEGSQFNTLLIIQPPKMDSGDQSEMFEDTSDKSGVDGDLVRAAFNSYALMMVCYPEHTGVRLRLSFDSTLIPHEQAQRISQQLAHIIRQLCLPGKLEDAIDQLDVTGQLDLHEIRQWNASVPDYIEKCVHDIFSQEVVPRHPSALAVCAWDGDMTYSELDTKSTQLARHLVSAGIRRGHVVPLCFEKSKWFTLAALGVMKAGGASAAMDVSQPQKRLQALTKKLDAPVILSSQAQMKLAHLISGKNVIEISDRALCDMNAADSLPQTSTSDLVYVSFTSGSTGIPKGACISHGNVASAIYHQGRKLGFNREARVFDFAPYSFDVAWSNVLHTLCAGGCLCVPSAKDMLDDVSSSITRFGANLINITPSALRLVEPTCNSLQTILLSGEMPHDDNIQNWAGRVHLINTYGPAECTFKSSFFAIEGVNESRPSIGRGVGSRMWIADTRGAEKLLPIGAVGELWLEGPLVGRGYINDQEQTAAAFTNSAPWSGKSAESRSTGSFYKTGDLVRYKPNGSLEFVGRKDSQVKIRGQRVELREVESHVRARFDEVLDAHTQIAAEVILPHGSSDPMLVVFVELSQTSHDIDSVGSVPLPRPFMDAVEDLVSALPAYMVPSAYFPLKRLPSTGTGKLDRKKLRDIGASLSLEVLASLTPGRRARRSPTNERQARMQALWALILHIDVDSIGIDDSFLHVGGDSIKAMRLVAAARQEKLELTVGEVFKYSRLEDMAAIARTLTKPGEVDVPSFSLLGPSIDTGSTLTVAAELCGVEESQVEDVFPCTPLQEGLLALTVKRAGDYVGWIVREVQDGVDVARLRAAWEKVVADTPILRTRVIDLPGQGLVQVVVTEKLEWFEKQHQGVSLDPEKCNSWGLRSPLARFGLLQDTTSRKTYFCSQIHHALFDGWSLPLLFKRLEAKWLDKSCLPWTPFQAFVRHTLEANQNGAAEWWQQQMKGLEASPFPTLPSSAYQPKADSTLVNEITRLRWPEGVTASTVLRAAWSVLAARYTNTNDVFFGVTFTGRQASLPGIDLVAGPTIASVPVRVKLDWKNTVDDFLQRLQNHSIDSAQFEQFGLQHIRRLSADTELACLFQTLLVVQPARRADEQRSEIFNKPADVGKEEDSDAEWAGFNSYGIMIICNLDVDSVRIRFSFDSNVIPSEQADRMSHQLEDVIRQMCAGRTSELRLTDLHGVSKRDLKEVWTRNAMVPETKTRYVHEVIHDMTLQQPKATAVCAWDGDWTYQELEEQSTRLSHHLLKKIKPGTIVSLCFEKSKWMSVAMLGVIKIGCVAVGLDVTQPEERIRSIIQQVLSPVIVSSPSSKGLASRLTAGKSAIITLGDNEELQGGEGGHREKDKPDLKDTRPSLATAYETAQQKIQPSDPLCIVFTSGTTGSPKGSVLTHANLSSAIHHHQPTLKFKTKTRTFDFVSYSFDAAWSNLLHTLVSGGCVCVPREQDRWSGLGGSIAGFRSSYIFLTPSLARVLQPEALPTLETIVIGGEEVTEFDVARWKPYCSSVLVAYGPTECSIFSTFTADFSSVHGHGLIGTGCGLNTWVVRDDEDASALAPVGAVGELLLEGPLVFPGYYSNEAKSRSAFVEDPSWLLQGGLGYAGRKGRLYRTGDLVRYRSDGSLFFIGRKDAQVKVRGQRVELVEVEMQVRKCLPKEYDNPIAAEMITPQGSETAMLVVFVAFGKHMDLQADRVSTAITAITAGIDQRLASRVPVYMIPGAYIPIQEIPVSTTGKTDRRRLRTIGSGISLEHLAMLSAPEKPRAPATEMEDRLQGLWSSVLKVKRETIGADASFLKIGGDSIAAMRLVAAARDLGVILTVRDVFEHPQLSDLATVARETTEDDEEEEEDEPIQPFSLLASKP